MTNHEYICYSQKVQMEMDLSHSDETSPGVQCQMQKKKGKPKFNLNGQVKSQNCDKGIQWHEIKQEAKNKSVWAETTDIISDIKPTG